MPPPSLLIGSELSLYREVLEGTLHALRPGMAVRAVPVADLDTSVVLLRPWLVICSAVTRVIEELAQAWILLYPEGRDAVVCIGGNRRIIPDPTIDELLNVIDEAQAMVTSG
ncbi:MAG: hypothetical protein M3440_15510 [Chloroflexota bacterium]|nr:hypothetical protein [Chloroflexota bacterium]